MNIEPFFTDLVGHFRSRRDFVRAVAVMAGAEHWFQMEAAALLDLGREHYGIGGGESRRPNWWVTCEHGKVDVWVEEGKGTRGVAIELKAIHNNKNFRGKIFEVRRDLSDRKSVPEINGPVQRYAIIIATFASYLAGNEGNYQRNGDITADGFREHVSDGLLATDPWYEELPRVELKRWERICTLDDARYIEPGSGCGVWIALATAV